VGGNDVSVRSREVESEGLHGAETVLDSQKDSTRRRPRAVRVFRKVDESGHVWQLVEG